MADGRVNNGGARPGSGPKTRRERFEKPVRIAEKRIADRLPLIIDRMFELADGVTVQERRADGSPVVYDRPPNYQAAAYLIDRILGKPAQAIEAAGEGGGPLRIIVQYVDADPPEPPPGPEAGES